MESLHKALSYLKEFTDRVADAIPLAIFYLTLLCLPSVIPTEGFGLCWNQVASTGLQSMAAAMLLALWSNQRRWLKITLIVLLSVLMFGEMYCFFQQGNRFDESTMFLIMQTNPGEAYEYLNQYFLSHKTLFALLSLAGAFAIWAVMIGICSIKGIKRFLKSKIGAIIIWLAFAESIGYLLTVESPTSIKGILTSSMAYGPVILTLIAVVISYFARNSKLTLTYIGNIASIVLVIVCIYPNMLWSAMGIQFKDKANHTVKQLVMTEQHLMDERIDFDRLNASSEATTAIMRTDVSVPDKIVLIIGESYSKPHSSLYGYPLPTNPHLQQMADSGDLVLYDDVIARWPITADAVREIFSTWDYADSTRWEDYPLLPVIMRKAGRKVALIDNQASRSGAGLVGFQLSAFYSTPKMNDLAWDMRNTETYEYDQQILNQYLKQYADSSDFLIVHLMGQHLQAEKRYPKDTTLFKPFTIEDYGDRTDLNDTEKQILAYYDNATLYNDAMVAQIIGQYENEDAVVIYFSDHGERIYDGDKNVGRGGLNAYKSEVWPTYINVPFMVWCSNTFQQKHPETFQSIIEAKDMPITTSSTSHMLIDLAGINTPTFKPSLSPLSSEFNASRPRYLKDGTLYTK